MTKRKTTQDERKAIVQYCLEHDANYGETAKVYKISYHQVYQWVKKYKEMGEAGLEDRRGHRIGSLPSRTKDVRVGRNSPNCVGRKAPIRVG